MKRFSLCFVTLALLFGGSHFALRADAIYLLQHVLMPDLFPLNG